MANPTIVGSAALGATLDATSAPALSVPAGAAAGDLMFYAVTFNLTGTVTDPDPGGGAMALVDSANTNSNIFTFLYKKVLTAGDLGGTVQAGYSLAASIAAGLVVIRGHSGDLDNISVALIKGTNSTTVTIPDITPVRNDCLRFYIVTESAATTGIAVGVSTPTGFTELQDVTTSGTTNSRRIGLAIGEKALTGQAGVAQGTASATDVTSAHEIVWSFTVGPQVITTVNPTTASATGAALFDTAGAGVDLTLTAELPVQATGVALNPTVFTKNGVTLTPVVATFTPIAPTVVVGKFNVTLVPVVARFTPVSIVTTISGKRVFRGPTRIESWPITPDARIAVKVTINQTLYRKNGVWLVGENLNWTDLEGVDRLYQGGATPDLTDEQLDELAAAGLSQYIAIE